MLLRISLPVANLLIYEPFEFAGSMFTPARDVANDTFSDEPDASSFLSSGNLSTAITAFSGVRLSDFNAVTVVSLDINADLMDFPNPNRQDDEKVLHEAVFRAEAVMDLIRFGYCRLDIPEYSPMMAGYFPNVNRLAVCVHNGGTGCQRLIAREPNCPIMIPGLGLELERVPSRSEIAELVLEPHADESLGVRLQRLLRVFGQAFTAFSDDQKILNLIFALDGLLTPENCGSDQFKKAIGRWLADDVTHQERERDQFAEFYRVVRNPLVHRGKSYEQLGRDRKTDLLYLQGVVSQLLARLSKHRHMNFLTFWKKHT